MQELLNAITDLVANSPPAKISQLASRVQAASLEELPAATSGWATTPAAKDRLKNFLAALAPLDIPHAEIAGMLLGASHSYHRAKTEETVDLIWTGPSSELVATRKTEQALLQVIQTARSKLFLTSFVAYEVSAIINALTKSMDRGVSLSMLLESDEGHGGGVSFDVIGKMTKLLPAAKIYFWSDKPDAFAGGKVHAKVAVADERMCFISSANLTGHAMEKNMEAGVLVDGGSLPAKLHRHLEALASTKKIKLI